MLPMKALPVIPVADVDGLHQQPVFPGSVHQVQVPLKAVIVQQALLNAILQRLPDRLGVL